MDSRLFIDLLPEIDEYFLDIHTAASIGCDERVRDIIENAESKCIVDELNKKRWTPLMYAACCANLKVVLLLLEEGAQTDVKNSDGHTALILASKCGSGDVVNLLIDSGAQINNRDLIGWTALFHAAAFGHRSVVQLLIERGATADLVDNARITPLMLAAAAGHKTIVKDLLQQGVNLNMESVSGDTARSVAAKNGHIDVKNLIEAHLYSKKKSPMSKLRSPDLYSLLKDLQLTKYYHIFENHEIDLNTFWLLTNDDLQEIGIQLIGPRKKICMTIAQYQQEHPLNGCSKEIVSVDGILMENKKLHQLVEKLKSAILHEKNLRCAVERNLTDSFQSFRSYADSVQCYLGHAVNLHERLKENQDHLKKLLCNTIQDLNMYNSGSKSKIDCIFQSLDRMQTLLDLQHQNWISMQNADFQISK